MKNEKALIKDFWHPSEGNSSTDLTENQIGWTDFHKTEASGYSETKDVWDHLVAHEKSEGLGFDLAFFFPETGKMYYLDNADGAIYVVPENEDLAYVFDRFDYSNFEKTEDNEIFDFEDPQEVWNHFHINGKNMKYILEHSLLILSH